MSKLTSKLVIMFSAVILSYAVILVYNFSHFTADVLNTHPVDIIFRGAENAAETFERMLPEDTRPDNFIPVSYTHLDVYKRQARRRLAGIPCDPAAAD